MLGSLLGFAALEQVCGHPENAIRLYGAVLIQCERLGTPLPPNVKADYDAHLHALRAAVGETEFARLWAEGTALSVEQAIEFAAVL